MLSIKEKPPGATNTERLLINSLAGCPEENSDLEHLNYIILGASWQGAYFFYPFFSFLRKDGYYGAYKMSGM